MALVPYSLKEGLAGFKRAKFAVITSTSAMAVALVLIGMFGLLSYQASQVAEWLRQRVGEFEIFLVDETDQAMSNSLFQRAEASIGVEAAEFISPERAQEIFETDFGEGAEMFMEDSFLPASIRIRVEPEYANPDSLNALILEFASWNRVEEVIFNQPLLVRVQENLTLFTTSALFLGIIVIMASIFLVANTIRLTIYARRLLIRTMKLVGATDVFIRRPFIVEGVLQGVLAGLLAGLVVLALHSALANQLQQLQLSGNLVVVMILLGVTAVGAFLGWVGSLLAVRRFIRNVQLH